MFAVHFREELDEPVARELDDLMARVKSFLLQEHNEDGTHRFGEADSTESSLTATIQAIIARSQDRGQWWTNGPWRLDDLSESTTSYRAFLRPPKLAAGTYHNYEPVGIHTAIGMEIEPDGVIALTGLKCLVPSTQKRLFILRNRDSTNSVTLAHEDTGSFAQNRFDLPAAQDIVMGPGQTVWLYYDGNPGRERWTAAVTPNVSGGIGSGDVTLAGTPDYLTIAGQVITRGLIDLTTDVTGTLPLANGGIGATSLKAAGIVAAANLKATMVTGGAAGNHTVTGIAVGDQIVAVTRYIGAGVAVTDVTDITGEFTVTGGNTINNAAGTDTTGDKFQVLWVDLT